MARVTPRALLSPVRKGAHDPANLLPIDLGLIRALAGSGLVRMVTLAPELPRAREAIRLLLEKARCMRPSYPAGSSTVLQKTFHDRQS